MKSRSLCNSSMEQHSALRSLRCGFGGLGRFSTRFATFARIHVHASGLCHRAAYHKGDQQKNVEQVDFHFASNVYDVNVLVTAGYKGGYKLIQVLTGLNWIFNDQKSDTQNCLTQTFCKKKLERLELIRLDRRTTCAQRF